MRSLRGTWLLLPPTASLLVLCTLAVVVWGQQQGPPSDWPVQFRRVYVPSEKFIEEKALVDRSYRTMKREEFEQLWTAANGQNGRAADQGARIVEAHYTARLEQDQLVGGQAVLEVVHHSDRPALLSLEPCRLALGPAHWDETPPRPAPLGAGPAGKLVAVVESSAPLRFPWSLRGQRNPLGEVHFDLRLPPCPTSRLVLDLPAELRPVTDRGIVSQFSDPGGPGGPGEDHSGAEPAAAAEAPAGSGQQWLIELGGHRQVSLRVVPEETFRKRRQLVLLQQMMTYQFLESGVELRADLHLDVHNEPLRQLTLELDPAVQLTGARLGGKSLRWTVTDVPQRNVVQVELELPEPIVGTARVLRLTALTPLVMGQSWKLPTLKPQGVFWQEGSITLQVPEPLLLEQLVTRNCRQSKIEPLPNSGGELIELQGYTPDAAVDLVIQHHPAEIQVTSGTTIHWDAATINGRLVADLIALRGQQFALELDVPDAWIIDTVETLPADALDDWTLSAEGSSQRLTVRLREAISLQRQLRLVLGAHRRIPAGAMLFGQEQFRLARFPNVANQRHLVALEAEPPYQVKLSGDLDLSRLDPQELSPEEAELVETSSGGLLFVDTPAADALTLALNSENPLYSARIEVEALVQEESLAESYQIRCSPHSAPIGRLLVHFFPARNEPLQWWMEGENDRALSARRLSASEQQSSGTAGGETWEIVLRRPRELSFELRASRSSRLPAKQTLPVSLPSLPEAASQVGTLVVGSVGGQPLQIEKEGLNPIPAPSSALDGYSTTRAMFRYEPWEDTQVSVGRAGGRSRPAAAWAWSGQLTSRFATDGSGSHTATYRIENTGMPAATVRLPEPLQLQRVLVNQTELPLPALTEENRPFQVPLPEGVRYPVLQLIYATDADPLGLLSTVAAPLPELELSVLERNWTVWLPPGYTALADSHRLLPPPSPKPDWSQRLLGPLRRSDSEQTFQVLSAQAWYELLANPTAGAPDEGHAQFFLQWLGQQELSHSTTPPSNEQTTWGELLTRYLRWMEKEDRPLPELLIDQPALNALGVTPRTLVGNPVGNPVGNNVSETGHGLSGPGENGSEQAANLLGRHNLALLVHPEALLLTSTDTLALCAAELQPTADQGVARIQPGWLAAELAAELQRPTRWAAAGAWTSGPLLAQSPWPLAPRPAHDGVTDRGWSACVVDIGQLPGEQDRSVQLTVYRPRTVQAMGWAVVLIAASLSWWLAAARPVRIVPLAAVAGITALWIPSTWVPLASGAFHGTLLAGFLVLVDWPGPGGRARVRRPTLPSSTRRPALAAGALVAFVTAGGLLGLLGTRGQDGVAPAEPPVYRVLIKVDDQQQPEGPYVWLPQQLEAALRKLAGQNQAVLHRWLLHAGSYHGKLTWDATATELEVTDLVAVFDLEVFQPGTRVPVPIAHEYLLADRARLDGQPIPIVAGPEGKLLPLEVPHPGTYRLELPLRAMTQVTDEVAELDMDIPSLPRSQLTLSLPAEIVTVEFPQAFGATSVDEQTGNLVVELGPSGKLGMRWPVRPSSGGMMVPDVEVEQLQWLRVRPSSVVVDARFKLNVLQGQVRELRLLADPRLRMLPLRADQPVVGGPIIRDGEPQTIHLALKPDLEQEITLHATFLWTGTSGVGNLRLPRLEVVTGRSARRWLAVSVAPGLEYEQGGMSALESLAPEDFLDAWGTADAPPQLTFRLPDGETLWSLATRPRKSQTVADQQLEVSLNQQQADVRFQAQLATSGGDQFQHRLTAPAGLAIQRVSVREADSRSERAARWSQDAQGTITVFFNRAISGEHQLELHAAMPLDSRQLALPRVSLADAQVQSDQFRIYRRHNVQVHIGQLQGLTELADVPLGGHHRSLGRLVAALGRDGAPDDDDDEWVSPDEPSAMLAVLPNRPQGSGRLITTLTRNKESWLARVDFELDARDGILDAQRLEIPAEWVEPFELDPPLQYEVIDVPGQQRRHLVIRPPEPVEDRFRVRIQAALSALGERVRAPDIAVLDVDEDQVERYLVVPTQVELQQIAWETSGLQASPLPAGYPADELSAESFTSYQVVGERFQAMIKDVRREFGVPQVRLADIHFAWRSEGTCYGVATFDLEPAGLTTCTLELPASYRLVAASVARLPATLKVIGTNRWQVQLGPDQLPQRIEVIFEGRLPEPPGPDQPRSFPAPVLANLPIERTLWTIHGPPRLAGGQLIPAGSQVDPLRQEIFRLRTTAALIDLASDVVAENAPQEIADWYLPWARRLMAARKRVHHWREAPDPSSHWSPDELQTIDREQAAVATRLGTTRLYNAALDEATQATSPTDICKLVGPQLGAATYGMFQGSVNTVELAYPPQQTNDFTSRGTAALLLGGLAAVAYFFFSSWHPMREHLLPCPHVTGVLIGLGWSLWLTPAFVGWAIALFSIWAALRGPWKTSQAG